MGLRKDLGFDEVSEDWYGMYILNEDGNIFGQVFGRTVEECEDRADELIFKMNR